MGVRVSHAQTQDDSDGSYVSSIPWGKTRYEGFARDSQADRFVVVVLVMKLWGKHQHRRKNKYHMRPISSSINPQLWEKVDIHKSKQIHLPMALAFSDFENMCIVAPGFGKNFSGRNLGTKIRLVKVAKLKRLKIIMVWSNEDEISIESSTARIPP